MSSSGGPTRRWQRRQLKRHFGVLLEELDGLPSSAFVAKAFTGAKIVKAFNHVVAAILAADPIVEGGHRVPVRPSLEVADIFRVHGPAWRAAHAGHMSLAQIKVMSAIETCRTAALGGHIEGCEDCGHRRIAYNSCRNRHCPKCQGAAAREWLAAREADLLPVGYFHVVFTVPAEVADIAFHNKAVVYDLLFRVASETMATIAADPRHLGARIGITAVLHSWGSAMMHHPHIHMIVPGGGISLDRTRWISSRAGFLLPVRVLAKLFRRLFLAKLRQLHAAGRLRFSGTRPA